jgi:hypothetical protein
MISASLFNENEVFAVFNNHRSGDFKPYILKSNDKGKTWVSISGNLPTRGSVYCIKQDFEDPNLLFAGTEFGAYFTNDGGKNWVKLNGLPTIAVYDFDIQKRENDLVAATFGRGFYVLDNYSPLRQLKKETMSQHAFLFPVKEALIYIPSSPLGLTGTENFSIAGVVELNSGKTPKTVSVTATDDAGKQEGDTKRHSEACTHHRH